MSMTVLSYPYSIFVVVFVPGLAKKGAIVCVSDNIDYWKKKTQV